MRPLNDVEGRSMLKLTSWFVLQVLPYLLMALAAVVLLPGVTDSLIAALPDGTSSPRQLATMSEPFGDGETTLDLIRRDHEAFAPNLSLRQIAKAAQADLEDR
jgi:hypothetical protein